MNKRRVLVLIAVSWVLSALLAYGPIFLGWYTTKDHLVTLRSNPTLCTFEVSQPYAFVSSSVSFWIPCTVMVVLYQRILKTAMRQERQIRAMMNQNAQLNSQESESSMNDYEGRRESVGNNNYSDSHNGVDTNSAEGSSVTNADGESDHCNGVSADTEQLTPQKKKKQRLKKDMKQMRKIRKEYRAVKTLGIVMGSFIFCMGPLFLWYTITFGMCPMTCELSPKNAWVITLVFWIGYFNSCMNPVIYAFFNREFQVAYRRLFVRKPEFLNRRVSTSSEAALPPSPLLRRHSSNFNGTNKF